MTETKATRLLRAADIAVKMQAAQVPVVLVAEALTLVDQDPGIYDLFLMWDKAATSHEKLLALADIQELIDEDYEAP